MSGKKIYYPGIENADCENVGKCVACSSKCIGYICGKCRVNAREIYNQNRVLIAVVLSDCRYIPVDVELPVISECASCGKDLKTAKSSLCKSCNKILLDSGELDEENKNFVMY